MSVYSGLPALRQNSMAEEKERRQILNYLALLDEKLRYQFQHIEADNMTEEFRENYLVQGQVFQNFVQDTAGNLSLLEQQADGLTARVADAEGNLSSLSQSAQSLTARVADAEGNLSSLSQSAQSLTVRVADAEGALSSLSQSAQSLRTEVRRAASDAEDAYSMAEQTAERISWIVSDGEDASSMTLTDDFLEIVADNVVVDADVQLHGEMTVWRTDAMEMVGGYFGYATGDDAVNASTPGIAMSALDGAHYVIATTSGVRMTAEDNAIVVMDNQIAATEEISISSDRRLKEEISYDMEKYEDFFLALKPSHYKYTFGQSGREHIGFIAQDVEEAIEKNGITTKEFAGLVQLSQGNPLIGEYADQYFLRYEDFIALNTYMIQKLMARVTALERKLEGGRENGETEIL